MSQATQYTKTQYGPQASGYATEATSYNELARVQNINIEGEQSDIYDRGLGEGMNASNTYYGPYKAKGDVSFDVVNFDFLKHWIGPKTGAGTVGDPYILTEAEDVSLTPGLQPFSIEKTNDEESTKSVQFAVGCVGTTFELSAGMGDANKLSFKGNFTARHDGRRASSETYVTVTDPAYIILGGNFKWGAIPTAISGVQEFTLNYDNGLIYDDDTRDIESRFQTIPHLGKGRKYSGRIGIKMSSALATTIVNNYYGYESSGTYTPEDGSNSISPTENLEFKIELVNASKYATIWLDECSIDRLSEPVQLGGGLVLLYFEFTARKGKDNAPIKWWSV